MVRFLSRGVVLSFISILGIFASGSVFAEEGFHQLTGPMPAPVTAVEKFTVAIWGDQMINGQSEMSTAFLVKVDHSGKKPVGLWVTCAHVFTSCEGDSLICGRRLYHHYVERMNTKLAMDGEAWTADIKKLFPLDKTHDLAAFTAEIPAKLIPDLPSLPQLHVWTRAEGERLYAIGSPMLAKRTQWNAAADKPANSDPQMFWSTGTGVVVTDVQYAKNDIQPILLQTVDLLPGNSGGPLIDAAGRYVGVNAKAVANFRYMEYDPKIPNAPQTINDSVPADTVMKFLDTIKF